MVENSLHYKLVCFNTGILRVYLMLINENNEHGSERRNHYY